MISNSVSESGHLVTACFSGVVTMQEIEQYFFWLVDNHDVTIKPAFSQIIYSEALQKMDLHVNDVQRIAHLRATVGRNSSGSRIAMVVPDLKYYWMARLYQTLSKSSQITTRLFKNIDQAYDWLEFDNPCNVSSQPEAI